jgi:hypothetical protein
MSAPVLIQKLRMMEPPPGQVNMASLRAAFEEKACVGMAELEHAKDKIIMGAERKSGEPGVSILQPVHIC